MTAIVPDAWLKQIQPNGSVAEVWAIGNKPLVVGRGDCADAFVEDDSLSRSHFLIVREGAELFLVDLDSRNGTWVNGKPVSAHKLHTDDIIHAGGSAFVFSIGRSALAPSLMPALLMESSRVHVSRIRAV